MMSGADKRSRQDAAGRQDAAALRMRESSVLCAGMQYCQAKSCGAACPLDTAWCARRRSKTTACQTALCRRKRKT